MLKLFKRLFTDSFAFAIASVGNKLVGLLLFPVFLRYMEQVEYADWGMTNTLTLVVTYLSVLGTDTALAFYYHDVKTEQERKAYLTATLITSSFVYCLS
jgi:O-antigen/teichoic acid export membrane protein